MSDRNSPAVMPDDSAILNMAASIVCAALKGPESSITTEALPDLIRSVHSCLRSLVAGRVPEVAGRPRPAVPVSQSVQDDYIVCLEDGKKLKMLKRHIRISYNLTPDQYRTRWGLPSGYPMVARNYSSRRSNLARDIGLGRRSMQEPHVHAVVDILPEPEVIAYDYETAARVA